MADPRRPSSLCVMPWVHLATTPLGELQPCCLWDGNLVDGERGPLDLTRMTLSDGWNSAPLQALRQAFLDGERPAPCSVCWQEEAAGKRSKRSIENERFGHLMERTASPLVTDAPVYLSLKLGNTCNLKCRICSSENSSAWVNDEAELELVTLGGTREQSRAWQHAKRGRWDQENTQFWHDLQELLAHVKLLDISGGEPFLVTRHFEVLRECVARGLAKDIRLHYNTNGTVFPEQVAREVWPHFKSVELMVSIDGTGASFEYQRHGASWAVVEANLKRFRDSGVEVSIGHTVSAFNVLDIAPFVAWARGEQLRFWLNILHRPIHFNVRSLPARIKRLARERIEELLAQGQTLGAFEGESDLRGLLDHMQSEDWSDKIQGLEHFVMQTDKPHGERFQKVFPELFGLLRDEGLEFGYYADPATAVEPPPTTVDHSQTRVELVLRNPHDKRDSLSLWLAPTPIPLAYRWIEALKRTFRTRHMLEKNYCFIGWPDGPRDARWLARELNRRIDLLNAFNARKVWKEPYVIADRCSDEPQQEELNRIHHHFEMLSGRVWDLSQYTRHADASTRYHIRQLNNLVHELEAFRLSRREQAIEPDRAQPHLFASFVQERARTRFPLEDEDYQQFGFDFSFGAVHMYYCQTGKTHFDAWKDKDVSIFDDNINGLRYYSGEFIVRFGKSVPPEEVARDVAPFYQWLQDKGAELSANKSYFVDRQGVRQTLGFATVARLVEGQFGDRDLPEIHRLLGRYLDLHKIRIHEASGVTESVFESAWTDDDFDERQIAILESTSDQ
jgi:molybdenum cofactor biosynthesis enzyme MoaA